MLMKMSCLFLSVFLCISCSSSKKIISPTSKSEALDALVTQKRFTIEANSASPQPTSGFQNVANSGLLGPGNTAGFISLTGSSNFITVKGDSVQVDLPYYGERRMGGGYNTVNGIKFNGIPKDLIITKNETNLRQTVSFKIKGEATEIFTINAILFPNWKSAIRVNSSQRTPISFQGELIEIEE